MTESIRYVEFYRKNHEQLVKGKRNIINALRTLRQTKEEHMKEYREKLRNNNGLSKERNI